MSNGWDLLGSSIFSQLFVLHEEIFPVSEGFPDLVPFVDSLDFEGSDVLYSRDGQGAVLQHELDYFMALPEQGVVKGSVPGAGRFCKVLECNSRHSYTGNILVGSKNVILRGEMFSLLSSRAAPFFLKGHKTRVKLGQVLGAGDGTKS